MVRAAKVISRWGAWRCERESRWCVRSERCYDSTMAMKVLSDEQIDEIEARRKERKGHYNNIPTGPYFYDSMGFVHNELSMRPAGTPARRVLKAGLLIRDSDWFDAIDMDANLGKTDSAVGINLGQYVALVLDHDIERDIDVLLAEVRRLRAATRS